MRCKPYFTTQQIFTRQMCNLIFMIQYKINVKNSTHADGRDVPSWRLKLEISVQWRMVALGLSIFPMKLLCGILYIVGKNILLTTWKCVTSAILKHWTSSGYVVSYLFFFSVEKPGQSTGNYSIDQTVLLVLKNDDSNDSKICPKSVVAYLDFIIREY